MSQANQILLPNDEYDIIQTNTIDYDTDYLHTAVEQSLKPMLNEALLPIYYISYIIGFFGVLLLIWKGIKYFKGEEKYLGKGIVDMVVSSDKFYERIDKRIATKTEPINARVNDMQENLHTLIESASINKQEFTEIKTDMKWLIVALKELKNDMKEK